MCDTNFPVTSDTNGTNFPVTSDAVKRTPQETLPKQVTFCQTQAYIYIGTCAKTTGQTNIAVTPLIAASELLNHLPALLLPPSKSQ